jgi:hypothetical protein
MTLRSNPRYKFVVDAMLFNFNLSDDLTEADANCLFPENMTNCIGWNRKLRHYWRQFRVPILGFPAPALS